VTQREASARVQPLRVEGATNTKWLYSVRPDMVIAWSWVPIYAVMAFLTAQDSRAVDRQAIVLMGWVFLVSLLHQPLTLLLVYGDKAQFTLHRRLFIWTPLIAFPLLAAVLLMRLWILVPVAAAWQIYHTQQQRYGLLRIYGRKSGYGTPILDRLIAYIPLGSVIAAVAFLPSVSEQLPRFAHGLGGDYSKEVRILIEARPLLIWILLPLIVATGVVLLRYGQQEAAAFRSGIANPAKWNYLVSSFALLLGLVLNPLAGVVSYAAAHAIEYVVVVHRTLISRYGKGVPARSPLATLAGNSLRRAALLVGFFGIFAIVDLQMHGVLPRRTYLTIVYAIGLMHFLYDGFIWKSRKPVVAAAFGVGPAAAP
jgi:hypothetical protein